MWTKLTELMIGLVEWVTSQCSFIQSVSLLRSWWCSMFLTFLKVACVRLETTDRFLDFCNCLTIMSTSFSLTGLLWILPSSLTLLSLSKLERAGERVPNALATRPIDESAPNPWIADLQNRFRCSICRSASMLWPLSPVVFIKWLQRSSADCLGVSRKSWWYSMLRTSSE